MSEVDEAMQGFAQWFGHPPIGAWSAPGRVNLIGEHTDYNDGFVFPFAIDHRTAVALGDRDDRVIRVSSSFAAEPVEIHLAELTPDAVDGWAAYPLGVAWALGELADLGKGRPIEAEPPVLVERERHGALDRRG